jgi:dUTPase
MTETIKFLKTREVKSPSRANKFDAGIDFYVPSLTEEFVKELYQKNSFRNNDNPGNLLYKSYIAPDSNGITTISLYPQERILIPSGIYCKMSNPGRALIAANKSGVATKMGLVFGAQVVDYEYQGEIHLSLINTGTVTVEIQGGMKVIQFLETPIYNSDIEIFPQGNLIPLSFYERETTRGADGFGSSDKK